ncbi:MAG: TonB-dependent receptor [Bacteroidetes bacterium]|nr:TonB-dependent receptor [Bacteroidota bacterium]
MKNLHLLIVCFCALTFPLFASGDTTHLSGKVLDQKTLQPIADVEIYFPDLRVGTYTKADGTYFISNLPKIKTLIKVSFSGFATITEVIDLSALSSKNFTLEEEVIETKEIVITGTSKATEFKKNPAPTITLDNKYLTQNASTNIIESLAKVPGVNTLSTGPNVSKPFIRGLGYNRVLTLFDGVRQDGQQWGDEHGIEVDQFLIDKVEIVKGPASLMYGSDAMGGVVNLIPANPVFPGTVKGKILSNYQSNNNQLAGSFAFDGNNNGFAWGFRASQKQAGNYENKFDGKVFGTKYNESDINAHMGLYKPWGFSYVNLSIYDNLQEIPDGSRDSTTRKFTKQISESDSIRPIVSDQELNSYKIGAVHQRVQHYRVYSSSSFIFRRSKLNIKIGAQQSVRQEFENPDAPSVPGLSLLLNSITYDIKYYLPDYKGWESTFGINGLYQQNRNTNAEEFVIPDYQSFDFGPFIFIKKSFGKVNLAGGLRHDLRNFKNDANYTFSAYSHTFSGSSGSIGATYNINKFLCFKANLARGYRAPNIAEISAKGVHPGTGFQQLGDANFIPEFNLQEDLGFFLNTEHISFSAEIFNNVISNYIYNEKLASSTGGDSLFIEGGNAYSVFKFKQTTAQIYGGEITLDIHPHPVHWLHIENSASFLYALNLGANTDSTRYLPYIPPFHSNSEIKIDIKNKIGCFAKIYFKIGIQYYAAQNRAFTAYGTETTTPGYTLMDAGLGGIVLNKKGNTFCSFTINGSNLADVAYQSNMSRLKYMDSSPNNWTGRSGIYSMGRNISVKLIFPINIVSPK